MDIIDDDSGEIHRCDGYDYCKYLEDEAECASVSFLDVEASMRSPGFFSNWVINLRAITKW